MSEYLTPANVAIVISLLMSLYSVIKTIAPKTKTTIDDSIVSVVEKGRPWVRDFAFPIWSLVEQLFNQGKILKNSKNGEYLAIFREGFKQAFGQDMPKELETDAQLLAQGLSAADKLEKQAVLPGQSVTPVLNPPLSQDAAK